MRLSSHTRVLSVRLGPAYGTKGGVWGRVFLAIPDHFRKEMELLDEAGRVFRVMRFVFKPKGHIIMFFAGITERSQAEALKGLALYLPKESLPSLEEGAFYAHALVGCVVFSLSGCKIGHISRVANFGAGELLEIIRNDPQKGEEASFWVPFKNAFVPTVNTDKQEIRVTDDVVALFGSGVGTCTSPS